MLPVDDRSRIETGWYRYQPHRGAGINSKYEADESMLEWIGGRFAPDEFDPVAATKSVAKGLLDWKVE